MQVLKAAGAALVGIILLLLVFQILGSSFRSLSQGLSGAVPGMAAPSMGLGGGYAYDSSEAAYYGKEEDGMAELSVRNAAAMRPVPQPSSPSGTGAEDYEVTEYNASIETRRLGDTCASFEALKAREDVVFESANAYDRGCSFTFKVEKASVEEVLAWLRDMRPRELSENTYTIKRQIDDFTNEEEVLLKKRSSIDDTLESALAAYDDITRLATNTQNAEALARIIDSRIQLIERLTGERININEQLDRLARAKADQLDRLDYTYFYVSVYENKYIDAEQLRDSWKQALRDFVRQANEVVQGITINLLLLLFFMAQLAVYALIALFAAKYGWRFAKYLWYR